MHAAVQSSAGSMRRAATEHPIPIDETAAPRRRPFGRHGQAVVDLARGIRLLDAELHADQAAMLFQKYLDAFARAARRAT